MVVESPKLRGVVVVAMDAGSVLARVEVVRVKVEVEVVVEVVVVRVESTRAGQAWRWGGRGAFGGEVSGDEARVALVKRGGAGVGGNICCSNVS